MCHLSPGLLQPLLDVLLSEVPAIDRIVLQVVEPWVVGIQVSEVLLAVEAMLGGPQEHEQLLLRQSLLLTVKILVVQKVVNGLLQLEDSFVNQL